MKSNQRLHQSVSLKKIALACAFALGSAAPAVNGFAASATSNADATVVAAIAIANNVGLNFGKFAAGTGGTVVMSAASASTRSATGGVVLLTGTAGTAAKFTVTGDSGATYAVTLPAGTATLTRTGFTETMTAGTWTKSLAGAGTLTGGTEIFYVGATLTVASAQVTGAYAGTFSVSVEYN